MKFLQKANVPFFFLLAYIVRLLITGASVGDALAVIGLSALSAVIHYIEVNKPVPLNDEVIKDIAQIKASIGALRLGANRNVRQ